MKCRYGVATALDRQTALGLPARFVRVALFYQYSSPAKHWQSQCHPLKSGDKHCASKVGISVASFGGCLLFVSARLD